MALVALMVTSCGYKTASNKDAEKATRSVKTDEFCKIEMADDFVVRFTQDSVTSVTVSGQKADVDGITVTCHGDVLTVKRNSGLRFRFNSEEVYINITSPNLTALNFGGSGEFHVNGFLDTDTLEIMQTGSGEVALHDVICDRLKLGISGSGDASIGRIRCGSLSANITGSCDFHCDSAQTAHASISVAGSGSASFNAAKIGRSRFNVTGSGDISILGADITYAENSVSGSGDIAIKGKVARHKNIASGLGNITVSK